jgi:cell division initiation protein
MITPIEIRQQAFRKRFRGLDAEEVRAFLQGLSQEWESLREENRLLKEELERTKASYHALKEVEDMLHKTLMQAERSSRDTLETARQKAELKLQEADSQAKEIIRRAMKGREELQKEIGELFKQREEVLMQLRIYLRAQLERLENFTPSGSLPPAKPAELGMYKQPSSEQIASEENPDPLFPENGKGSKNGKAPHESQAPPRTLLDDISDAL